MSRRIGIASLIWGVSILLSRVVGVVREAVIGRVLGGGSEADVYWTAFVLPDFLNYLLAGGALSIVFIPMFSRHLSEDNEDRGWEVFSNIANFVLLLMGTVTAVAWFYTPQLVPLIAPGFDEAQLELLTELTRIVLPAQLFHLVGGLLSAVLQSKDRHLLPALATLAYTGGIVGMGLIFGPTWGAKAFAWGVLVGSAVGPFGLPLIGCLRTRLDWQLRLDFRDPEFKRYFVLSFPIMIAFSVVVVDDWLLKRYGSLAGEGTVSRLTYGKTLMKVPMGIFGLATGTAAYPTLSRLMAEGKKREAYDTLVRACRMMLVLAFSCQAAFTVAGTEVATVIWGTNRFTGAELAEIGLFTGLFCIALGAWSANTVVGRGFYAAQMTWTPSLVGSLVVLFCVPLYAWLGRAFGGAGLALASSFAMTTYVIILAVILRRVFAGPESPHIGGVVLPMLPATAIGIGMGFGLRHLLLPIGLPVLVQGSLTGGTALLTALLVGRLLGVREVATVVDLVWDKVRRKILRR